MSKSSWFFSAVHPGPEIFKSVKTIFCSIELDETKTLNSRTRDRCYDFFNIFAKKIGGKNGVFDSKQS
jgi:hypothetical protein